MRSYYNPYPQHSTDKLNEILTEMDNHLGLAKLALANYEQYILDNMQALCQHHHIDRHLWEANLAAARAELVNINTVRHRRITEIKQELMRAIDLQRAEYHATVKKERIKEKSKQEEAKRKEANMSPADRAMHLAQQQMAWKG